MDVSDEDFRQQRHPCGVCSYHYEAIKKAEKDGAITSKNRWQLIEMLATEYLAGK